jgi:UDP-2,3-diacylglucosamine hydrolase
MSASNIYFASDFHLGVPNHSESLNRERRIVRWLESIEQDAKELYLMGDLFDFWFEFKKVVPKGFVRLLGKLGQMSDKGIKIYIFKGNHDMWMYGYLEKEIGAEVISDEKILNAQGKKLFLHHGDGLGPGDPSYKLLKRFIFKNPFCQFLFKIAPPSWGLSIAEYFSSKSRLANIKRDEQFDESKEWLLHYCKEKVEKEHFDYFIFGHRHLPLDLVVKNNVRYINLGEWVNHSTYAVLKDGQLELKKFEEN